jgi:FlaG/FlaF family flagellin (archaellin)
MVAITVILAAVIAAFVFGMSGNIQKTKIVASTVTQPDTSRIIITYQGGQDDQTLTGMNITAPNGTVYTYTATGLIPNGVPVKPSVGATMMLQGTSTTVFNGQDHVVVIGTFSDGANQVITDTYV